jgi:hypothetical protein
MPPHGNIPSALWLHPLMAIFLWPCSRASSQKYSFGVAAVPPHGNISSGLAAVPHGGNQFSLCLTAIIDLFRLHGNLCLMVVIDFLFASWQ